MERGSRWRFWVEAALAGLSGFMFALTLVWRDWIEGIFGADPDAGSGLVEWLVVLVLLVVCLFFSWLARAELRRVQPTADGG